MSLSKNTKLLCKCVVAAAVVSSASMVADNHYKKLTKLNPHGTKTVLETYYNLQKNEPVGTKPQIKATMEALDLLSKYYHIAFINASKKRITKLNAKTIRAFNYINVVVNSPKVYFEEYMDSVDLLIFINQAIPVLNGILWQQFQQQEASTQASTASEPERAR